PSSGSSESSPPAEPAEPSVISSRSCRFVTRWRKVRAKKKKRRLDVPSAPRAPHSRAPSGAGEQTLWKELKKKKKKGAKMTRNRRLDVSMKEPETAEGDESVSHGGAGEDSEQKEEDGDDGHRKDEEPNRERAPVRRSTAGFLQRLLRVFFGCLAAVACGMLYAVYLSTYHDRKFWFSTRQELEREITFQAGSGLYYYYYKHMVAAPSFDRGT
ncbi:hypothetical protein INR49_019766, partial [Caranx melampygus]